MSRLPIDDGLSIGELAQRSGLSASRIRFYDASSLLGGVRRRVNGYRTFAPSTLSLLTLITSAQSAGFSLEEIRSLLPATSRNHDERVVARLRAKVVELEALMKRLAATRRGVLAVIDAIADRPPTLDCAGKLERVLATLPATRPRPSSASRRRARRPDPAPVRA